VVPFDKKVAKAELFYRYHLYHTDTMWAPYTGSSKPQFTITCCSWGRIKRQKGYHRFRRQWKISSKYSINTDASTASTGIGKKWGFRELPSSNISNVRQRMMVVDFGRMRELLKTKQFMKNYEDLHEDDESDED
jgi:hypothetical protein